MNHKPYLIVVTGRPGSGKTTLSQKLGEALYMPVVSRDRIKEGYVHTAGISHSELPQEPNKAATEIFFSMLMGLIDSKVSVIAEAAFQHALWSQGLEPFMKKARLSLLICTIDDRVAVERCVARGLANPSREYFHGAYSVQLAGQGKRPPYEAPRLDVPTYQIDTTGEYDPSIQAIKTELGIR